MCFYALKDVFVCSAEKKKHCVSWLCFLVVFDVKVNHQKLTVGFLSVMYFCMLGTINPLAVLIVWCGYIHVPSTNCLLGLFVTSWSVYV